jgi:hypothetical protein
MLTHLMLTHFMSSLAAARVKLVVVVTRVRILGLIDQWCRIFGQRQKACYRLAFCGMSAP